jgi:hypothetical protein
MGCPAAMIGMGMGQEQVANVIQRHAIALTDLEDLRCSHSCTGIKENIAITAVKEIDIAIKRVSQVKARPTTADEINIGFDLHRVYSCWGILCVVRDALPSTSSGNASRITFTA